MVRIEGLTPKFLSHYLGKNLVRFLTFVIEIIDVKSDDLQEKNFSRDRKRDVNATCCLLLSLFSSLLPVMNYLSSLMHPSMVPCLWVSQLWMETSASCKTESKFQSTLCLMSPLGKCALPEP